MLMPQTTVSSRLIRTLSVAERSPMMRRAGSGSFLTSVGIATIWSSLASSGLRMRSITSMVQRPGIWLSQIRRKLAIAATDRVDCPATYRRIRHDSFACGLVFFTTFDFCDRDPPSFFGAPAFFFTGSPYPLIIPVWRLRQVAVCPAAPGHCSLIVEQLLFALVFERNRFLHPSRISFEFGAQRFDMRLHRLAPMFELRKFELVVVTLPNRRVPLLLFECHP